MLKSIDFWPLVPKKLSVESSINNDIHQKSMFNLGTYKYYYFDYYIKYILNIILDTQN